MTCLHPRHRNRPQSVLVQAVVVPAVSPRCTRAIFDPLVAVIPTDTGRPPAPHDGVRAYPADVPQAHCHHRIEFPVIFITTLPAKIGRHVLWVSATTCSNKKLKKNRLTAAGFIGLATVEDPGRGPVNLGRHAVTWGWRQLAPRPR